MNSTRSGKDWALFVCLTVIWAGAYALTRLAVDPGLSEAALPPSLVVTSRLAIAALLLGGFALVARLSFPPLRNWRPWAFMAAMGIFASVAPFYVISTGQQSISSSLAALYVAASPLFVAPLAHVFFRDEKMTVRTVTGILVGFAGVIVLFGPDALQGLGTASVTAQALCLLGTFFYAIGAIILRAAPPIHPVVFSAGYLAIAAVASLPLLATVDLTAVTLTPVPVAAVIGLGIGPTAIAAWLYTVLIRRTSAGFLAQTGYTIPLGSALLGFLIFGETHHWSVILAAAMILFGVWLARGRGKRPTKGKTVPQ